jgi:hypothetical protein
MKCGRKELNRKFSETSHEVFILFVNNDREQVDDPGGSKKVSQRLLWMHIEMVVCVMKEDSFYKV